MTTRAPTFMRCERCKALVSIAEASETLRHGAPCGICGGTSVVCGGRASGAPVDLHPIRSPEGGPAQHPARS